jgi:GNAT superfamily N-acetyltransferase
MATPDIHTIETADLADALGLSASAGWNQREDDWRMLLRLAPAGSFCAKLDGRVVGTAIGIDYVEFGWIAMMLVDPAVRGRGIGRRLLEAALQAIPDDRPIRLDATPMGRPLYQQFDFHDEAVLTRHVASSVIDVPPGTIDATVRPMRHDDLPLVGVRDRDVFRAARGPLLRWALESAPKYARILVDPAGNVHYCLGRQGALFDQVGPVVSDDGRVAGALAGAALAHANGRPVAVDAFDGNAGFTGWLAAHGFEAQRPLYRMCRLARSSGERLPPREPGFGEFAILGPEFA